MVSLKIFKQCEHFIYITDIIGEHDIIVSFTLEYRDTRLFVVRQLGVLLGWQRIVFSNVGTIRCFLESWRVMNSIQT